MNVCSTQYHSRMTKASISAATHLEVRCHVCRARDWERGGPGRADKLGVVDDLGELLMFTSWSRLPGDQRNPEPLGRASGATTPIGSELRAKCRRGHRINRTRDEVAQAISRAARTGQRAIYL